MSNIIDSIYSRSRQLLKENSPTILTYIGAIGVISTAVLSAKATPKAIKLAEKSKEEKKTELTKVELVVSVLPAYIPTIAMASGTIFCIFGANVLNKKKQASIMSAYAMLNNYHKNYRNVLIEKYGEEVDEDVQAELARQRCDYHQIGIETPDQKMKFFDQFSGKYFTRYEREIMDAEYHLNRNFIMRGYSNLNEFYTFLGLPETEQGEKIGWSCYDGYCWIDFQHLIMTDRDDPGEQIYMIDYIFEPTEDYMRDWE